MISGHIMRMPLFSIRFLMAVVVLIGLGIAALKYANQWVASAIYTLTLGLLLFSLVGMVVRRGDKQLFWAGFGVFGFGYFLHAFEFSNNSVPDLLFVRVIEVSIQMYNMAMHNAGDDSDTFLDVLTGGGSGSVRCQSQVFHSFIALCSGLFGLLIARLLATKKEVA